MTQPRLAGIHCLNEAKLPLSAREVFENIRKDKRLQAIDQVSVYRILQSLLVHGLVHQVAPGGTFLACTHTTCSTIQHALICCRDCGSIHEIELPEKAIAPLLDHLKKAEGFQPFEHVFQLDGQCTNCLRK